MVVACLQLSTASVFGLRWTTGTRPLLPLPSPNTHHPYKNCQPYLWLITIQRSYPGTLWSGKWHSLHVEAGGLSSQSSPRLSSASIADFTSVQMTPWCTVQQTRNRVYLLLLVSIPSLTNTASVYTKHKT